MFWRLGFAHTSPIETLLEGDDYTLQQVGRPSPLPQPQDQRVSCGFVRTPGGGQRSSVAVQLWTLARAVGRSSSAASRRTIGDYKRAPQPLACPRRLHEDAPRALGRIRCSKPTGGIAVPVQPSHGARSFVRKTLRFLGSWHTVWDYGRLRAATGDAFLESAGAHRMLLLHTARPHLLRLELYLNENRHGPG